MPTPMAAVPTGSQPVGDSGMLMEGGSMGMMSTWFLTSNHVTLLVKGWETENTPLYIASLVAVFVFGFLYEALSLSQLWIQQRVISKTILVHVHQEQKPASQIADLGKRSLLTLVYGVRIGVGYLIMLAVMSFNLGVYLAVVLGMAVGFFLLRSSNLSTDA